MDHTTQFSLTNQTTKARPLFLRLTYILEDKTEIQNSDETLPFEKIRLTQTAIRLNAPVIIQEKIKLLTGIEYQLDQLRFFNSTSNYVQNLYTLTIPMRAIFLANPKWNMMTIFSPGIYSDMDGSQLNNIRFSAMGLWNYAFQNASTVSLGIAYARVFGDEMLFPVAGATFRIAEKWEIMAVFPRPAIGYTPTQNLKISAFATPAGSQWNIKETLQGTRNNYELHIKGWRIGASFDYALRYIKLNAACGFVTGRKYKLVNSDNDETITKKDIEDTFFFQIGLGI